MKSHLILLCVMLWGSGQLSVVLKDAARGYMNSTDVLTQLFSLRQNKRDQFETEFETKTQIVKTEYYWNSQMEVISWQKLSLNK